MFSIRNNKARQAEKSKQTKTKYELNCEEMFENYSIDSQHFLSTKTSKSNCQALHNTLDIKNLLCLIFVIFAKM